MTDLLGQIVLSVAVLALFGAAVAMVLWFGVPDSAREIANVLLGSTGALATTVVNYWCGSSRGSARKTELLASSVPVETPHS